MIELIYNDIEISKNNGILKGLKYSFGSIVIFVKKLRKKYTKEKISYSTAIKFQKTWKMLKK